MNILINGCSFMDNYYYREHFNQLLNASTVVNIARAGSSNRRIIRTTVDYIEQNPVDLVVLGLTFYDRQESPLVERADPWVSYNSQGIQAQFASADDFSSTVEHKLVDDYVRSRYKFDINQHYIEQLYLDLKMLAAYLREQGIKFLIFNTCDAHLFENLGEGFVPFTFIGNVFLEQQGAVCMEQDRDLPVNARHHYGKDVIMLVRKLLEYID